MGFVSRAGTQLTVDGRPFRFGGTNAELLGHLSDAELQRIYSAVADMDLRVVRTWAYRDRGSLDGSRASIDAGSDLAPVYYAYWDGGTGQPVFNTSDLNGLGRLDAVVAGARRSGLRLILTLTNNWANMGGVDQYNIWYGLKYHDDFFTHERARAAFKRWISELLNRRNVLTGVPYRDEPAILAWELGNELFCFTDDYSWRTTRFVASRSCSWRTLYDWTAEISAFIKSQDPVHLVSIGNSGFLDRGGPDEYGNVVGDDFEATLAIPSVDLGTFHLYIDNPDRPYDQEWGLRWIRDHLEAARRLGKPVLLEEFGHADEAARDRLFDVWLEEFRTRGGAGWLVWQVRQISVPGMTYQIDPVSSTGALLRRHAQAINQAQ